MVTNEGQLFWDDQDPNNSGWWLRYRDEHGVEQGCAIDGDEDNSVGDLAARVVKACSEVSKINVYRGDQVRAVVTLEDGTASIRYVD